MSSPHPILQPTRLLPALGGPVIMGACLGIPHGLQAMLIGAGLLPAILLGVGALMLPPLYIGSALLGQVPTARDVVQAAGQSLHDLGMVMAGFSPAVAFLLATSKSLPVTYLLFLAPMALAAILGLRALYIRLSKGEQAILSWRGLYLAWSTILLGIGLHFYWNLLRLQDGGL